MPIIQDLEQHKGPYVTFEMLLVKYASVITYKQGHMETRKSDSFNYIYDYRLFNVKSYGATIEHITSSGYQNIKSGSVAAKNN